MLLTGFHKLLMPKPKSDRTSSDVFLLRLLSRLHFFPFFTLFLRISHLFWIVLAPQSFASSSARNGDRHKHRPFPQPPDPHPTLFLEKQTSDPRAPREIRPRENGPNRSPPHPHFLFSRSVFSKGSLGGSLFGGIKGT